MNDYPRGSEWRKWDLHIHTPYSVLNNGFGSDWDNYAINLFRRASDADVAVAGITDYFSIAGYRRLRDEYLSEPGKLAQLMVAAGVEADVAKRAVKSLRLLPNVELRLDMMISTSDGRPRRINLHVVFSDLVEPQVIEEQFLRSVKFKFDVSTRLDTEMRPLTRANLEELGAHLKRQHSKFRDQSDYYIGCMNACVSEEQVLSALRDASPTIRTNCLLVLAEENMSSISWDGQSHLARKLLYRRADMLFSSSAKTIAVLKSDEHAQEFGKRTPCIWGSDAHDLRKLFAPDAARFCWIKANPTFRGLQQVLQEPERVHIGEAVPELDATKNRPWMSEVEFSRADSKLPQEKWFHGVKLKLNPGLVAIIGNKGSGKSALADALALAGRSKRDREYFSFLHKHKFCRKEAGVDRSSLFQVKIGWNTGEVMSARLSDDVGAEEYERVRYLPQGYLERICGDSGEKAAAIFEDELKRVIFSHVPVADRLGCNTLDELIDHRCHEHWLAISELKRRVRDFNRRIHETKSAGSAHALSSAKNALEVAVARLAAHDELKPAEVKSPAEGPAEVASAAAMDLNAAKTELANAETALAKHREVLQDSKRAQAAAEKLTQRLHNFEAGYEQMLAELDESAAALGIALKKVVALDINIEIVAEVLSSTLERIAHTTGLIERMTQHELPTLKQQTEASELRLQGPEREYQLYLTRLQQWQAERVRLLGIQGEPGTIAHLREQIRWIEQDAAPAVAKLSKSRDDLTGQIYELLLRVVAVHRDAYEPLHKSIEQLRANAPNFSLKLDAKLSPSGFHHSFFDIVTHQSAGTFCGTANGKAQLTTLLESASFESHVGVEAFINRILDALRHDRRSSSGRPSILDRQLRQSKTEADLNNLVYSLDYLNPVFELRLGTITLRELSPGERGLLLLTFYLLVDQEDIPLLLDQPEENLDNQSIKSILVPLINKARLRRQVIIVTHNANLAVVCDAEQIVRADLDKSGAQEVRYTSGAIESREVNGLVVDILEGTAPAFTNRHQKYVVGGSLEPPR